MKRFSKICIFNVLGTGQMTYMEFGNVWQQIGSRYALFINESSCYIGFVSKFGMNE